MVQTQFCVPVYMIHFQSYIIKMTFQFTNVNLKIIFKAHITEGKSLDVVWVFCLFVFLVVSFLHPKEPSVRKMLKHILRSKCVSTSHKEKLCRYFYSIRITVILMFSALIFTYASTILLKLGASRPWSLSACFS